MVADKPVDWLLTAIMDPNAAMEDRFKTWTIKLKSGVEINGFVGHGATACSLLIRRYRKREGNCEASAKPSLRIECFDASFADRAVGSQIQPYDRGVGCSVGWICDPTNEARSRSDHRSNLPYGRTKRLLLAIWPNDWSQRSGGMVGFNSTRLPRQPPVPTNTSCTTPPVMSCSGKAIFPIGFELAR